MDERINKLKIEVYDILATIEQLRQLLNEKNQEINKLTREKKGEKGLPEHNRQEKEIKK